MDGTCQLSRRHALQRLAAACGAWVVPALAGGASADAPHDAGVAAGAARAVGNSDSDRLLAAAPWNALAFAAVSQAAALQALGLQGPLQDGEAQVQLRAPELAENGAVVPVSVHTTLAGVQRVVLLVPKNPNLLAAQFRLSPQVRAEVSTRLKLAETGPVVALVQAADGLYVTQREVKITIGGCGG